MEPGCIVSEYEIPWQSDQNFSENIYKIVSEFKEARDLHPINILVHGPIGVGKSTLSKKLAEYYNIPFISLNTLVTQIISKLVSIFMKIIV